MNSDFILFSPGPLGLFATAILSALLATRFPRWKVALSFLTAFLSEIGLVFALITGATLQQLLIPFLILLWISLRSHLRIEGEEK